MSWKVVNRNGQKPNTAVRRFGYISKDVAEAVADRLNDAGFDDGPFTVQDWGASLGWFSDAGRDEAAAERGEEPGA